MTVNNFSIWRRHLTWAMEDGGDLRNHMTQRYASNMVFLSLLLGTELSVLFNPDPVTSSIRLALSQENVDRVEFWIGLVILVSIVLTLLSLISTFTAWGMVSSISDCNAHCVLRSSIGQYVAELPGRLIVLSIYSFLVWVVLSLFLLLPLGVTSAVLVVGTVVLFFHVVVVFSAFGRIIMHTGAMGSQRIFTEDFEERLLPRTLHTNLLRKAQAELANHTSITRQYRRKSMPIHREFPTTEDLGQYLRSSRTTSHRNNGEPPTTTHEPRARADSTVRFADQLWSTAPPPTKAKSSSSTTSTVSTNNVNNSNIVNNSDKSQTPVDLESSSSSSSTTMSLVTNRPHQISGEGSELGIVPPPPTTATTPTTPGGLKRGYTKAPSMQSVEDWLQAGSVVVAPAAAPTTTTTTTPPANNNNNNNNNNGEEEDGGTSASEQRDIMTSALPPPPINTITTNRTLSVSSSIHGSYVDDAEEEERLEYNVVVDDKEEEERFQQEYGDLFDPEGGGMQSEQQHLLSSRYTQPSFYSSTTTTNDKDDYHRHYDNDNTTTTTTPAPPPPPLQRPPTPLKRHKQIGGSSSFSGDSNV